MSSSVSLRRKRSRQSMMVSSSVSGAMTCILLLLPVPSFALTGISQQVRPGRLDIISASTLSIEDDKGDHALTVWSDSTTQPINNPDKSTTDLPPWLSRLGDSHSTGDIQGHMDWLEYALLEQGFTFLDARDILLTIEEAAKGDRSKLVGMIEFCRLILQLEDPTEQAPNSFVTKEVLLASALHYGDCVTARQTGVYEMVKRAVSRDSAMPRQGPMLPSQLERHGWTTPPIAVDTNTEAATWMVPSSVDAKSYADYGDEVLSIAKGAARVKRAEILAHSILEVGRVPSREEASRLRGLLLSVMDDWRGLAIRSVASLYRLEGILKDGEVGIGGFIQRTPQIVQAAREALHVYAPLAQRLGMPRLKSKLEDRAFRILYRRQYRAVSALYQQKGENMYEVSTYLTSQINRLLRQNQDLMDQLEDIQVMSRVKEPYSLWKKLLRIRWREAKSPSRGAMTTSTTSSLTTASSTELSLLDVKDGVALRIILRARKRSAEEPDETTRARERLLCYYAQHLLRTQWPMVDRHRAKDYIQFPKSNGYQSLHYTSTISNEGQDWPFEVQVRSEEMHRIAEYGVAAHWDYKLGNKNVAASMASSDYRSLHAVADEDGSSPSLAITADAPVSASGESYIDALVTARKDLVQQNVFVFFAGSSAIANEGQLLSLPVGARVSDALTQLEVQMGENLNQSIREVSVLRNGRLAKSDEYIGNGDVLLLNL